MHRVMNNRKEGETAADPLFAASRDKEPGEQKSAAALFNGILKERRGILRHTHRGWPACGIHKLYIYGALWTGFALFLYRASVATTEGRKRGTRELRESRATGSGIFVAPFFECSNRSIDGPRVTRRRDAAVLSRVVRLFHCKNRIALDDA